MTRSLEVAEFGFDNYGEGTSIVQSYGEFAQRVGDFFNLTKAPRLALNSPGNPFSGRETVSLSASESGHKIDGPVYRRVLLRAGDEKGSLTAGLAEGNGQVFFEYFEGVTNQETVVHQLLVLDMGRRVVAVGLQELPHNNEDVTYEAVGVLERGLGVMRLLETGIAQNFDDSPGDKIQSQKQFTLPPFKTLRTEDLVAVQKSQRAA